MSDVTIKARDNGPFLVEGPVNDVWALLSRRGDSGDTAGAEAVRQGERLLAVTGQLPADSLRAMVRRVNAARRVR